MEQGLLGNVVVYLMAALLMVPLAQWLGLGAVLGYLLAGMAIGPWMLGLVKDVETILHFSEFGVVLMMFLIGLELELKKLWALRRSIFGCGSAQMIACTTVFAMVGWWLALPWQSALVVGMGLALSSTALALALLQQRNLLQTPAGSTGFGILLFQDVAAIPILALLPLLAGTLGEQVPHTLPAWLRAARGIAVIALIVVIGRVVLRPLLRGVARMASTGSRELFTALALLLVIANALLMQSIGLSMAMGTFLAGVLLADSEYRHALEAVIEPFKGLLLGLFFIAVGMSIDFSVLLAHPYRVGGLVGGFLLLKLGVLWGLSALFGVARTQRLLFALLLSQGGEFAFVVFGAALSLQVIAPSLASLMMLLVALSMVSTPLLLWMWDAFLIPRMAAPSTHSKEETIEAQDNPVIIAGFGRVGQVIGRMLHLEGVGVTVLEHDPEQIEVLRQFGFKVFYGDATRMELLAAAGAEKARLLVIAVDDIETSLEMVDRVKQAFPHLRIHARARNVTHAYQLFDRNVASVERETFEAALRMGRHVLEGLGVSPYEARAAAMQFRRHNIRILWRVYPHYKDRQRMISETRQAREEVTAMFEQDRLQRRQREGPKEDSWQ